LFTNISGDNPGWIHTQPTENSKWPFRFTLRGQ